MSPALLVYSPERYLFSYPWDALLAGTSVPRKPSEYSKRTVSQPPSMWQSAQCGPQRKSPKVIVLLQMLIRPFKGWKYSGQGLAMVTCASRLHTHAGQSLKMKSTAFYTSLSQWFWNYITYAQTTQFFFQLLLYLLFLRSRSPFCALPVL